jgi:hypothetical protein
VIRILTISRISSDAVSAGLYACEDDVIRDALLRLKDEISKEGQPTR